MNRESTAAAIADVAPPSGVAAIGRLTPRDGILHISGPSRPSIVIDRLLVQEGDRVAAGQPIAELDSRAENEARVFRADAELRNAKSDLSRLRPLVAKQIVADKERDRAETRVDVAKAELIAARAALDRDVVRAPADGQIVKIHAHQGERVGPGGIAELAQNDQMFAVAEVYETDIGRIRVGQRATLRSPALEPSLMGSVDRIGLKIGKLDIFSTDPVAAADARVVEVWIKIDDSSRAAGLSNLQVEVEIEG
jgi:HlyD family secretion protein